METKVKLIKVSNYPDTDFNKEYTTDIEIIFNVEKDNDYALKFKVIPEDYINESAEIFMMELLYINFSKDMTPIELCRKKHNKFDNKSQYKIHYVFEKL